MMNNEQGFEHFWRNDEVVSGVGNPEHDMEEHVKAMCLLSWQAGNQFVEAPSVFVNQDKAEKLANELLGKYIAACGCQNKNQIYKASLKLLAVVSEFVEFANDKPAVSLVNVDGKPIR